MSYKLLITGSSGFIGRYVVKEPLLKKFELLTPSSKELNLMNPKSVSKYIEKNKPDYLIHLAWITNPGIYKSSLENGKQKKKNKQDKLVNPRMSRKRNQI